MNPHAGEVVPVVGRHVLHPALVQHLGHVVHHVDAHQPLILPGRTIDLRNRESPFVDDGLVETHAVVVTRKHLAERGGTDRPLTGLRHAVLEVGTDAQLGHRSSPTLTAGTSLVAETPQVVAAVAGQVAIARQVEAGGAVAVDRLVVESVDAAPGAQSEVVVHQVVSQLARTASQPVGPDVGG